LRGQINSTNELISINKKILEILRSQLAKGYASELDVAAQEAQLAQTVATLPPLLRQLAQQRDPVLSGGFPNQELPEKFELSSLQLPREVPLTLPSQLVEQRPDVRQAEENLHSASALIGVADANRLPNFTLTADAGTTAVIFTHMFSKGGFWDVGGGLAQPVFDGGALLHRERAARAASREVSRLSRTDKDWYRLVEVCQIFGTLIGDEQHVYDLSYLDDQLVLGIKGTLSVVEWKVLRQRMPAGQESKARRGELCKRLPVGYIKDANGKVVRHSDRRVVEAIQLVFTKFRELWSVRQTLQWLRDHDVELPANPICGTRLIWKIPSQSPVRDILRNPFYAGAYVWGKRPVETLLIEGRLRKRQADAWQKRAAASADALA